MTDYYVDPTASGDNDGGGDGTANDPTDGNNWTHAWESIADAVAGTNGSAPAAGDVVYLKHTNTPDEDVSGGSGPTISLAGTNAAMIFWIGVSSAGAIDGTRYIIDGGGTDSGTGVLIVTGGYNWIENIAVNDGNAIGINTTTAAAGLIFINCKATNCDTSGFSVNTYRPVFFRCLSVTNGASGFISYTASARYLLCHANGNVADGFTSSANDATFWGCLSQQNTGAGFKMNIGDLCLNCVSDDNTDDSIIVPNTKYGFAIIGNRLTESEAYGLIHESGGSHSGIAIANYIPGASEDRDNASGATSGTPAHFAWTRFLNNFAGTDTDGGYVNPPTDFNLAATATLRRQAITIPTS